MNSFLAHKPEEVNVVPTITITDIKIEEAACFLDVMIEKFKLDAEEHVGLDFKDIRKQTYDIEELSEVIKYGRNVEKMMAENKLRMDGGIPYEQN